MTEETFCVCVFAIGLAMFFLGLILTHSRAVEKERLKQLIKLVDERMELLNREREQLAERRLEFTQQRMKRHKSSDRHH